MLSRLSGNNSMHNKEKGKSTNGLPAISFCQCTKFFEASNISNQ